MENYNIWKGILQDQGRWVGHVCLNLNFSAKFSIGLHVILQIQKKRKIKTVLNHNVQNCLTQNPLEFNVKGTQMGPLLVLVSPCFRKYVNVTCKIVSLTVM